MEDWQARTKLLLSDEQAERLEAAHIAVFGIGGVGGYVAEALARSGIGHLTLIDHDTISVSNLNRQIIATREHIGEFKVDVMKERILSINPEAEVQVFHCFFLPGEPAEFFPLSQYSYVVDAIDTVSAKIELACLAQQESFRLISSMGTGNKMDPSRFRVADVYETRVCPLAKVMRKELRARGIDRLKVVYSEEEPLAPRIQIREGTRRSVPGSISFVPAAAGLVIAGEVIKDLINLA
ncbi:MAG: tRNA threonylcarbamoyladenosine dehydratase [Lachnospiraceae bacterium]|nr:tRNA threonylcarbamoyladenosine dehydratase [Lachnospiraceae bacterium]